MDIAWASPQANIEKAERAIAANPSSDLYVLPEMWATGFATEPQGIARTEDESEALAWMRRTAAERQCAVCGSLAVVAADGTFRNRHYFVDGKRGTVSHYDKHHLFTYGHEDRYYTPGQDHTVVDYDGVGILLTTCYDLRFPLWNRYGRAGRYDMIVAVANWPESRQTAWHVLTRARAIENQCFLVGVNRVGDDRYCHYAGESLVVGSDGKPLAECAKNKEEAKSVSLDFASLESVRARFKVLDDRD